MHRSGFVAVVALLVACQSQSPAQQRVAVPDEVRGDTALAPQFALHSTYGGKLQAPEGLEVDPFAHIVGVRFMVLGPDGSVYASRPGAGEIIRLVDANGDGVAEANSTALFGLNEPHGMAFFRGASLRPSPPGASKHQEVRYLDIHEDDRIDEQLLATWIRQASQLPGWKI